MAKRKPKVDREREEKEALERRLYDMAAGAYGGYSGFCPYDGDFLGMTSLGLDTFGRWLGAIKSEFLPEETDLVGPIYLEHFDSLKGAADFLWKHGVRA